MKRIMVFFGLLLAPVAFADVIPDPYRDGASLVIPGQEKTDIVMTEEFVRMHISPNIATIHATFLLRNSGAATSVELGFLGRHKGELGNFKAVVDRRVVAVREGAPSPKNRQTAASFHTSLLDAWKLWNVKFAAGQSREVEVSYVTPVVTTRSGLGLKLETSPWYQGAERAAIDKSLDLRNVSYVLWTGSYWKGPIGRCQIEVSLEGVDPGRFTERTPEGGSVRNEKIVWDLREYEPRGDLSVSWLANNTAADMRGALENILKKHPEDIFLGERVGYLIASEGDLLRQLSIYRSALDRWNGRLPSQTEQGSQTAGMFALWRMMQTLMKAYDQRNMVAEAKAVAPRIEPFAVEMVRRTLAEPSMGKFGHPDLDEEQRTLALCRKYGPKKKVNNSRIFSDVQVGGRK